MQPKLSLILGGLAAGALLAACNTVPTMSLSSATAAVGDDIIVSFDRPIEGRASNLYWLALQSVDMPETRSVGRIMVEHGQTTARVRATEAGSLEIRLHNRYPQEESHLVGRAPVRIFATRDKIDVPPAAGALSTEKECLDQWLASQKLDAYGAPEGSVYANTSPLFDPSSKQMKPRTEYLFAKLPNAKLACASPPARSGTEVRAADEQVKPAERLR
jgi:hypothetical protein